MRTKRMTKKRDGLGIAALLATAALVLASCDGGSTGSDPEIGDSSSSETSPASSGIQTNSSSGGVTPGSSSSGTQTDSSSSSALSSSGGTVSSSSYTCDEGDMVYLTLSGVKVYYTCEGNTWVPVPVSSSSSSVVSSSSALSSSSYYDMDSLFNGGLSYGEFTDPRDGQTYKTIVIGYYQYEYFAENLNYGKQVGLGEAQTDSTKYCYDDDAWYCGNHFGGLYRWSTAMGFPAACDSVEIGSSAACPDTIPLPVFTSYPEEAPQYPQVQGVCPEGWHVMNQSEWNNVLGGGAWKIESAAGWNDNYNNTLGFSALPGGGGYGTYTGLGTGAMFWLPQETFASGARSVNLTAQSYDIYWGVKSTAFSVRCVRDHEGI